MSKRVRLTVSVSGSEVPIRILLKGQTSCFPISDMLKAHSGFGQMAERTAGSLVPLFQFEPNPRLICRNRTANTHQPS